MSSDREVAQKLLESFLRATTLDAFGHQKSCEKKIIDLVNNQAKNPSSAFKKIHELSEMPSAFNLKDEEAFRMYEKLFEIGYSKEPEKVAYITKGILPFLDPLTITSDPFLNLIANFGYAMGIFSEEEFDFISGQLAITPLESPRKFCTLLGSYLLATHKIPESTLTSTEYERLAKKAKALNKEKAEVRVQKAESLTKEMIEKHINC